MKGFLARHGFKDAFTARRQGFFGDEMNPLHVAAKLGDHEMVSLGLGCATQSLRTFLLSRGVDPHAMTSSGRSAQKIAAEADKEI